MTAIPEALVSSDLLLALIREGLINNRRQDVRKVSHLITVHAALTIEPRCNHAQARKLSALKKDELRIVDVSHHVIPSDVTTDRNSSRSAGNLAMSAVSTSRFDLVVPARRKPSGKSDQMEVDRACARLGGPLGSGISPTRG